MSATRTLWPNDGPGAIEACQGLVNGRGLLVWPETTRTKTSWPLYFDSCSGDTGNAVVPDVTFNQASNVVLVPDSAVPAGMRCYIERLDLGLTGGPGGAPWTTGTCIEIQDGTGVPLATFPLVSLFADAKYTFPETCQWVGNTVTVTGSSSTTTVTNLASTPFVAKATNSLVGAYVKAVSGTAANIGQVRRITDHNTTSFTVGLAWPAAAAAADTFIVYSHQGVATMSATVVTANDALTTATMSPYMVTLLTGTGAGVYRSISANTGSALTVPTLATAGDTTTTFAINNVGRFFGAFDFGNVGSYNAAGSPNSGIQAAVIGSMGAGSPVRIRVRGFFAK